MDDFEIPLQEEFQPFRPPMASSFISTGSLRLDIAMGCGGIARGEFIEICGPEGSGKTTLCLHILAEAQGSGKLTAFIDGDHSLDLAYAKRCGLDPDRLYVFEPECLEQALDILEILAKTNALTAIVVDSIAALPSRKEIRIPVGKKIPIPSDELLSRTLRKLKSLIFRNRTAILVTNLIEGRSSVVYHMLATKPGRLALRLHAAQAVNLRPVEYLYSKNKIVGTRIEAHVLKNKFAPCSNPIRLDLMYNSGINKTGEIFDLANQLGIIGVQDSTYKFQGLYLGRDREEAILVIKRNPSWAAALEQIIHQALRTSQSCLYPEAVSGTQADCMEV
jgi:recombination protein RecA